MWKDVAPWWSSTEHYPCIGSDYWLYCIYLCEFLWASLHLYMTDGDPDVLLTASHLRDVPHAVKTTPVYCMSPHVWNIKVPLHKNLSHICSTATTEILSFQFLVVTSLSVSMNKFWNKQQIAVAVISMYATDRSLKRHTTISKRLNLKTSN